MPLQGQGHAIVQQPAADVVVAVVVPAWGQPGLLPEAIESALAQQGAPPLAVVVVDDGCSLPQTSRTAGAYAVAYPGRVHALRRRNGGLSAARNTGIGFALAAFPRLEAVYFLDADNRLHPGFIARALAALRTAPAKVGWVYPDFDMFGEARNFSAAGEFALLPLLFANFCEAGSMVRAALLRTGLRFDETLKAGFEDWDFWLSACTQGFRGQHLPMAGFQYRKRPESMLRQSERQRPNLVQALRQKHRALYAPRHLLALEAAEHPRFALYLADQGIAALCHDPAEEPGATLAMGVLRQRFVAALAAPMAVHVPPIFCFADSTALALLRRFGLAQGVFWRAEMLLRECQFVALDISMGAGAVLAVHQGAEAAGQVATAPLIFATQATMAECAGDTDGAWLASLGSAQPLPKVALLRVVLPSGAMPAGNDFRLPFRQLLLEAAALGAARRQATALPVGWRDEFRQPAAAIPGLLRREFGLGATLLRRPRPGTREIGFIMPIFSFAGTEKVVQNHAAVLRARGWRTHLIIAGTEAVALGSGTLAAFDSITLFAGLGEAAMAQQQGYLGIGLSGFAEDPRHADVLGLLAGLDVVLNTHVPGLHGLMAQLRQLGVRTFAGLHVTEMSPWGQPMGNPHLVLPYEYAFDGFTVISGQLREWCMAQGIPAGKLHLIRNAPAFAVAPAGVRAAVAARQARGGPLRVLSLGRLDAQKGLDRLAALANATAGLVQWRILGGAVLGDQAMPSLPVPLEPPATTSAELEALYAWADVVVLPSRYEGVPLTLLEAQRMGVVPLATNVGAVAEIIQHGVDGLLVPHAGRTEAAILADFTTALTALAADRPRLLALGNAAAERLAGADWAANMAGFLAHLDHLVPPEPCA